MRSTLVLLACLLLVPPVRGDEEPPAPASEVEAAGAVGRALLSADATVRRAAVDRLLTRIERGGDLGGFLDAMAAATRAWADRHERLMEVWLEQAVHGTGEERERAVRLLTALGETAVRRLAIELRRVHGPEGPPQARSESETVPPAGEPRPPGEESQAAPSVPRVYDLRDLVEHGMRAPDLRDLLEKTANAVQVKSFKTQFVVNASDAGHAALRERLHDLRVTWRLAEQQELEHAEARASKSSTSGSSEPRPAAIPEAPAPSRAPVLERPTIPPPPAPPGASGEVPVTARWQVSALLFHLPHAGVGRRASAQRVPSLPLDLARHTTQIATGGPTAADSWIRTLQRSPDARAGLPWEGPTLLGPAETLRLFSGRQVEFSKSVARMKEGAWTLVMGRVPHGIALDLRAMPRAGSVNVAVVATHTEVGLPLPVVRVKPSPEAAPIELERPEWSTTRTRATFRLPLAGGSVLLSLGPLAAGAQDRVVVVLTLTLR